MLTVRPETTADYASIREVNTLAFESDVEARLVEALRDAGYVRVSLVAELDAAVVGHILFSDAPIETSRGRVPALCLAPMAVNRAHQRRGVGSELVRQGLRLCREGGHSIVHVLGHPEFYRRLGFSAELARPLTSQFGGGDVWLACELVPGALAGVAGTVVYPPPFSEL